MEPVPTDLIMPATGDVPPPPIATQEQLLPFDKLSWQNFERLCLRIVGRDRTAIEGCSLYGTTGQSQQGIDIYARPLDSDKFHVVQCKKVQAFTPSKLNRAVRTFRTGRWARVSDKFVICTSFSAIDTDIRLKIEEQRALLKKDNISFEVWDADYLSRCLKADPELVLDFFGRIWMDRFCTTSPPALKHRLDASEMNRLRAVMRDFYGHVFNNMDPGIPVRPKPGIDAVPLVERYEPPDVLIQEAGQTVVDSTLDTNTPSAQTDQRQAEMRASAEFTARRNVLEWLSSADRSVIIGGPGAGKSALLRYIAIDLLSEAPAIVEVNPRWAGKLPVWLPFAFWTRVVSEFGGNEVSLAECLRRWFHWYGKGDIFPLVEQALGDHRLALLVDGLDESVTIDAGRVASHLLRVFVEDRGVALAVTSRPYGLTQLPAFFGSAWQQASLAPLSATQREQIATMWFRIRHAVSSHGLVDQTSLPDPTHEGRRFIEDLSKSRELSKLASEPLLLMLLLFIWFQGHSLPRRRFRAYDEIIKHFIEFHPAARRESSLTAVHPEQLDTQDVRDALADLAFVVQRDHEKQLVSNKEMRRTVEAFLMDSTLGLGMQKAEARRHLDAFSSISEGDLGILVRQPHDEVAFLHRSFQEYLAGEHLARKPLDEQVLLLASHGGDSRWREVILALMWHTTRAEDLRVLVHELRTQMSDTPEGIVVAELLAEISFGEFRCPPNVARELSEEIMFRVERHGWLPHRRALLEHVIDGLQTSSLRGPIQKRISAWAYKWESWMRPALYQAMAGWQPNDEIVETILTGLYDEDIAVQRAAANSAARLSEAREGILTALADVGRSAPSAFSRAAALRALAGASPGFPGLRYMLAEASLSMSPELRLVAMSCRVSRGERHESDFNELCSFLEDDDYTSIEYSWRGLVTANLIEGWSGDERLLKRCLTGLENRFGERRINSEAAFDILVDGFPQNTTVADYISTELRTKAYPLSGSQRLNIFSRVAANFRDNAIVVEAFDDWLSREQSYRYQPEISCAARVGRTPAMKEALLTALSESFPHWPAETLLDEWGMADPQVHDALMNLALSRRADSIAFLIPRILGPEDAERRLCELVREAAQGRPTRLSFVFEGIRALQTCNREAFVPYAVEAVRRAPKTSMLDIDGIESLVQVFGADERVREFAVDILNSEDVPLAQIALKYGDLEAVREKVLRFARPLPKALRVVLLEALSAFRSDEFATDLLGHYYTEADSEVRVLSSIAYHRRVPEDGPVREAAVARAERDIRATGFHLEVRRRGALAALIVLRRLGDAFEQSSTSTKQIAVGLIDYFRSNVPMARLIAEEWHYVTSVCGEQNVESAFRWPGSRPFWDVMSAVANDFEFLKNLLTSKIFEGSVTLSPEIFRFLSRARHESQTLRDLCLGLIKGNVRSPEYDLSKSAAVTLGTQYRGDTETYSKLIADGPELQDSATIIALCTGWPSANELGELYLKMKLPSRPPMTYGSYYQLEFARCPVNELVALYRRSMKRVPRFAFQDLRTAIENRLRWDGAARAVLIEFLTGSCETTLACNIPRLLKTTRPLEAAARDWCIEALREDRFGMQLAFDLYEENVRLAGLCLLDALSDRLSANTAS